MTKEERFIEILKQQLENGNLFEAVVQGTVVETSDSTCKVKLTDNDLELDGVLYTATEENTDGFILIPKLETNVLIGLIGGNENSLYLVRMDEVEAVKITIENTTLVIDKDGTVFNGGSNGGLVIAQNLSNALNTIISDLNLIKSAFSAWAPIPSDGGAALKTATSGWWASTLPQTNAVDFENDKVTH